MPTPQQTNRGRITRRRRAAVLPFVLLFALLIGGVVGQSALGDAADKIEQKQDELDRIQSLEGPLRSQIDQMNAEVDRLIGEESRLRQERAAAQHELALKQAELEKATAELNAQKAELARVRAKLQEAVGALQQLLIEIYKSNEPDVTAVVVRSASGYDCSGAVSYMLHGGGFLSSPLDSTGFMIWGESGGGNWITVFANSGHAWAYVAGLRWDTGGPGGGNGPRGSTVMRDDASSFVARHPSGY